MTGASSGSDSHGVPRDQAQRPRFSIVSAVHDVAPYLQEDEARNRIRNRHPRRWQFSRGDRVINLEREPNAFTGGSTTSLYRLDRIRQIGLEYDVRIRPAFEDGHFAAARTGSLRHSRTGMATPASASSPRSRS